MTLPTPQTCLPPAGYETLPLRLTPGQDLRTALEAAVQSQNCRAAFVLSGIGSLSTAGLRFAGADLRLPASRTRQRGLTSW